MKKIYLTLLCLLSFVGIAFAQTASVKGTVTSSDDGLAVIGASIVVTGTSVATITDLDGNFTLTGVPANAATITVSCIGMVTKEVAIAPQMVIVLDSDSENLDEAVVTIAYGAAKRSSITGAISSVNSEKISLRTTSSVISALEGNVSGVQIAAAYGAPGEDPSIQIRGIGTVNGKSKPLYVIDGMPFDGNISDLNPSDIESMTVLKDGASAALYGNRASNGVILITTKQASKGGLSVSADVKLGTYSRAIKEYDRLDANEFMEAEWMNVKNYYASKGEGDAAQYACEHTVDEMLYLNIYNKPANQLFTADGKLVSDARILDKYAEDLDWFGQTIRNGTRQEYNVSASMGGDKADGFFSIGYLSEDGYLKNSAFDRITGRANMNVRPTSWMKLGLNLSGSHQNRTNSSGVGDGSSSYVNPFMYCRTIAPIYPVHLHDINTGEYILDSSGQKQFDGGSYRDAQGVVQATRNQYADRHVIWENLLDNDRTVRNTLEGIAYADFYFLKDFTLTIKGDLNVRNSDNQTYNSAVIGDGKGSGGRAKKVTYRYKNYDIQQQLRWVHQFGDHGVNVLLGHENYSYNYDYMYAYKTGEVFANQYNLSNFTNMTSLDGYEENYRTESYLARARYNYKEKYNLEGSFRRDGSSRFYSENRWGNFWSIGANWVISKENWMQGVNWVNSLKLRADYGEVGNDAGAGYYGYMALYAAEQNANRGAYYLSQNSNYDLKWETGQSWGVGVESRLFDRLNFNIEYFDKRNKDLLFNVYMPLSAGATSSSKAESVINQNIGVISNRGIEVEFDIDIFRNKDWRINFGANATFLKNKIVTLPEQNRKNGIIDGTKKYVEGGDRYAFYLYSWAGVDQMTGQSVYTFDDEKYYITDDNTATGKVIFGSKFDAEGNENTLMSADSYSIINKQAYVGKTTYAKREFCGSSIPVVSGGFNLNASWRGLVFSALFTYSLGGKMYDGVYADLMSVGGSPSSMHKDILNSWSGQPAGMTLDSPNRIDPNGIPEINYGTSTDNNAGTSSRWLISSDYLVLRNVALSYNLPGKWAKALQMQGILVSLTCENLFILSARQGMNPQQSFSGTQSNYLVPARVFSGSLSFRF